MSLRLDFCSAQAARYACEHWHYSRSMPSGKTVKIGVWEDEKFVGCVIFGSGSCRNIGKPFGLNQQQVAELCRVALTKHEASVSRIVSISLRLLQKVCPGLVLIVSYADSNQGHHGGIYQAGNWFFIGVANDNDLFLNGKLVHCRSAVAKYGTRSLDKLKQIGFDAEYIKTKDKYKYVMPLTKEMHDKIKKIALQYPKRAPVVQE